MLNLSKIVLLQSLILIFCVGCGGTIVNTEQISAKNAKLSRDAGVPYYLPRGLAVLNIERKQVPKSNPPVFVTTAKFEPAVFAPDPNHFYFLRYHSSIMSNDEVTLEINQDGLLQSVAVVTEDQTPRFVSKLVELATETAKAVAVGAASVQTFSLKIAFDPTNPADLQRLQNEFRKYRVSVVAVLTPAPSTTAIVNTISPKKQKCEQGVCHRPGLPYTLVATVDDTITNQSFALSTLIQLPNQAPVFSVALNRKSFVKSEETITFNDGMLVKWLNKKPSEAIGFMQIPIDVAKSIVSIPSAIFDFKVQSTTKEVNAKKADVDLIKQEIDLIKARQDLISAQQP